MIDKLFASSRAPEVDTVSTKTSGAFANTTLNDDTNLVEINGELVLETQKLTAAIKRSRAESVLGEKDEVRDMKIRTVYYLVTGFLYHPEPEIYTAAEVVMNELGKYGLAVIKESFEVETSHISSMLNDFAKPKVKAAIDLLSGVAVRVAELQTAETDFEQTSITFDEEKAKEGTLENATDLKKNVLTIINERLVVYLNAMAMVNIAKYGDYARTVAQIIEENNRGVKKRHNKNSDKD